MSGLSDYADLLREEIIALSAERDELKGALRDTLCELTACAGQLAARGLKGREGDSVSRAQKRARAALGSTTEAVATPAGDAPVALTYADGIEAAAKAIEPKDPRGCDCEPHGCSCGNYGDAQTVAAWDEAAYNAKIIRALSLTRPVRGGEISDHDLGERGGAA